VKFVKPLLLLVFSSFLLLACNTAPEAAATADSKGRGDRSTAQARPVQTIIAQEKPAIWE
jgi:hypothetical protein